MKNGSEYERHHERLYTNPPSKLPNLVAIGLNMANSLMTADYEVKTSQGCVNYKHPIFHLEPEEHVTAKQIGINVRISRTFLAKSTGSCDPTYEPDPIAGRIENILRFEDRSFLPLT
jgi:hypothetical protein